MLDAVQDSSVLFAEDDIAVLAHKLHDQPLAAQIPQIVQMLDLKFDDPLKPRLAYL